MLKKEPNMTSLVISIITLGGAISEYTSRKKVPVGTVRDLIYDINAAASVDALKSIIENAEIPKAQKKVLTEIASSSALDQNSREALARKLYFNSYGSGSCGIRCWRCKYSCGIINSCVQHNYCRYRFRCFMLCHW